MLLSISTLQATSKFAAIVADLTWGVARSPVRRSSSRTTRTPLNEVSTTQAWHSRLKSSTTHQKLFLMIQPVHFLVIHPIALPHQQPTQASIAKAAAHRGQFT